MNYKIFIILFLLIFLQFSFLSPERYELFAQTKENITIASEHLNKGKEALSMNNLEEAENEFRQALKFNKKLSEAHLYLAITLEIQKRYTEALEELEICSKFNYNNPDIYVKIAHIYEETGKLAKAVTYYKYAVSCYDEFNYIFKNNFKASDSEISVLEETLEDYPSDNHSRMKLTLLYEQKGKTSKALYQIKKLLSYLTPASISNQPLVDTVDDYINSGKRLLKKGDFKKALSEFNTALQKDGSALECYYYIGLSYHGMKKYDDAIKYFKIYLNSITCKTEMAKDAYEKMGGIYENKGSYQEALSRYKYALSCTKNYEDIFNMEISATDEEISRLKQQIQTKSDDCNSRVKLGLIYEQKGYFKEAVREFKSVLKSE
jgi:tetratricopeptide (TPR) repeat protein